MALVSSDESKAEEICKIFSQHSQDMKAIGTFKKRGQRGKLVGVAVMCLYEEFDKPKMCIQRFSYHPRISA